MKINNYLVNTVVIGVLVLQSVSSMSVIETSTLKPNTNPETNNSSLQLPESGANGIPKGKSMYIQTPDYEEPYYDDIPTNELNGVPNADEGNVDMEAAASNIVFRPLFAYRQQTAKRRRIYSPPSPPIENRQKTYHYVYPTYVYPTYYPHPVYFTHQPYYYV